MKVWTEEELRRFLAVVREDPFVSCLLPGGDHGHAALRAAGAATGGRRPGEGRPRRAAGPRRLSDLRRRLKEVNKTQAGRRAVSIDPEPVAVLRAWQGRQADELTAWAPAREGSGFVFTREQGGWINPETFSWWFDRHAKRLGLPKITVHGLRQTHVTTGLLAGVDPKTMAQRVGHPSIKFMYNTYAHLIPRPGGAGSAGSSPPGSWAAKTSSQPRLLALPLRPMQGRRGSVESRATGDTIGHCLRVHIPLYFR